MANAKSAGENIPAGSSADRLMEDDDLHCQALVWNSILAVVDSMVLKCAVKFGLFDAIHRHGDGHPVSLLELAAALPMPQDRLPILHRLMRYLAHLRLVDAHHDDSYTLTKASSIYLREASEKSHAAYVKFFIEEDMISMLHAIDTSLGGEGEMGATPTGKIRSGESIFERTARDPMFNKRVNNGMLFTVRPLIEAVLKGCPEVFDGVNVLVDVGGGVGVAAAAVKSVFSNIRCIAYDQPQVMKEAPKSEFVEYEAGDMLVSVPHADAFMFIRVLHICDDEKALQILNRCREVIAEQKGKLIIIDGVINETDAKELLHVKLAYDIMLMQYTDGKERTEKEWRSLLLKAGFTSCKITYVKALQHIIEARP